MTISLDFPYTAEGIPQCQILILGPPDTGKSYMASKLVPLLVDDVQDRVIVLGPPSAQFLATSLGVNWIPVSTVDREAQEETLRPLFDSPKHNLWVVDEMDTLMTMGGRGYGCAALHELVQTGRSLGKSYIGIAHGSPYIAKSAIQNAGLCLISRSQEPGIKRYANEWMSTEIDEPDVLIASLPRHYFLVWAPQASPSAQGILTWNDSTGKMETHTLDEIAEWDPGEPESEPEEQPEPEPEEKPDDQEEVKPHEQPA